MGKFVDFSGMTFGKLAVVKRVPGNRVMWLCQCQCGRKATVTAGSLVRGTKSCGCLKHRPSTRRRDLTGTTFGRLTAVCVAKDRLHERLAWECICGCGRKLTVTQNALQRGNTKSCGCLKLEMIGARRLTHGMSRTPEYNSWSAMKDRCGNPNNQDYANYGGRGIVVCERWAGSFENFLADMGHRPFPRATIEREDVNGNYEPGNCRWASQKEQTNNKRNNVLLTLNGTTKTVAEWVVSSGLTRTTIEGRLQRGWTIAESLTLPKSHKWSRRKRK